MRICINSIVKCYSYVSCGNDDGGEKPCSTCNNIAGVWDSVETKYPGTCAGNTKTENFTYQITQSGCGIIVSRQGTNLVLNGQICNNTLSWSGSYAENNGTVSLSSSFVLTGNASFEGTVYWTFNDGINDCSGHTDIKGTKQP